MGETIRRKEHEIVKRLHIALTAIGIVMTYATAGSFVQGGV